MEHTLTTQMSNLINAALVQDALRIPLTYTKGKLVSRIRPVARSREGSTTSSQATGWTLRNQNVTSLESQYLHKSYLPLYDITDSNLDGNIGIPEFMTVKRNSALDTVFDDGQVRYPASSIELAIRRPGSGPESSYYIAKLLTDEIVTKVDTQSVPSASPPTAIDQECWNISLFPHRSGGEAGGQSITLSVISSPRTTYHPKLRGAFEMITSGSEDEYGKKSLTYLKRDDRADIAGISALLEGIEVQSLSL